MNTVNMTELQQHLPDYLKQVQQGEEIVITLHGKIIARLVPDDRQSQKDGALKRLAQLRGTMIVNDLLEPLNETWTGDADHL